MVARKNMKTQNIIKFGAVVFFSFLIIVQTVKSIGVSEPSFGGLKLSRGDSSRFNFKIFAVNSKFKQSCSYSISGLDPLIISYDEEKTIVDAGGYKKVYGTFSIPEDAPIKTYNGKLTASCQPIVEGSSGSFIQQSISVNFNIDVIGKEEVTTTEKVITTTEIPEEVPEERQPAAIPYSAIITMIIIVILAIGVYYWSKRKRTKNIVPYTPSFPKSFLDE